ncbi:disintegrin and metalloproteinase domain-containing protein 10 [Trichonephila inaurata madagascariensis]|uniref:Disintegrin and metalloproteinase domain-containing protein 10 n=1 Tax=Trichonephila inaurata madagascariensis TaxID=2747483 RepID=A0A8X6MI31_9ARAC|nr:disintegrin and metalloproteinase domain-containing protein 10 [Trichonephila inaurata madagascariensis]
MLTQVRECAFEEPNDIHDYVDNFIIAECEIIRNGNKRSLNSIKNNETIYDTEVEILLRSKNESFHLLLFEDVLFGDISLQTKVSSKNNSTIFKNGTINRAQTKFYEGILKNNSQRTSVIGYLNRGVFWGTILNGKIMHYVEPIRNVIANASFSYKVAIYKNENINFSRINITSESSLPFLKWFVSSRTSNITLNETLERKGVDFSNRTKDLFCEIEIVVDHTLYQYFKKDSDLLSAYLYLHVKHSDRIFRRTDFSFNGKPDGIGISISKISIYKTANDSNYPMAFASNLSEYLTKFVTRRQESHFCLSISMSYRSFKGPAIGEAFRPDIVSNFAGGICEVPLSYSEEFDMNFNLATINLRQRERLLPLAISLLAFVHEIGHGFGSEHDNPSYKSCSSDGSVGKYLMHPKTVPLREQLPEFSPCSRIIMGKVLQMRGNCLRENTETCGNGIREGREECDCGWATICSLIDPCCNPLNVEFPEVGCTLKGNDSVCSPKESDCCTNKCAVNTNKNYKCYSSRSTCSTTFCDGISPECPKPQGEILDFSCGVQELVCKNGVCNESPCEIKNLRECNCTNNVLEECVVCCERNKTCVPSFDLGILNPAGGVYVHKEGRRCNFGLNHCDGIGNCIENVLERGCARCMTRVPYGTLIATIFCCAGVLTFLICLYPAVRLTLRMFDDVFTYDLECSNNNNNMVEQKQIKLLTSYHKAKIMCMAIVYILNLAWLAIACCLVVVVFVFHVCRKLCENATECVDLQQFHFLFPNGTELKKLNICEKKKMFCTDTVIYAEPYYILSFVASVVVLISLLHYIMCLAANYTRIKDQEKFKDLQELQYLQDSEMGL